MTQKTVLIGIGTCNRFAYCEKEVFKRILNQTFKDYDVLVLDNSEDLNYSTHLKLNYPGINVIHRTRPKYFRDAVGQARKAIIDYAVIRGYSYLFFVDADFILKLDTLEKLMLRKKDFVTAVVGYLHDIHGWSTCYRKHHDLNKVSKVPGLPAIFPITYAEMDLKPQFTEIVACGLSCCLLNVNILLGMDFFVSHSGAGFMEDLIFCRDLRRKGIKLFLDKTSRPIHLHVKMQERNFRAGF